MPLYSEAEWQQRLAAAVEKTLRERARKRDERREMQARRDAGKAIYHARKLAQFARDTEENR